MEADNLGRLPGCTVAEMALHGIAHHLPKFRERLTLCGNGVAERDGDIAAIDSSSCTWKMISLMITTLTARP